MIYIDYFHHWWQYLFIGILFALVVFSIIRNRKCKPVQLLTTLFGIDIFIHVIFRYGQSENFFIYGGHWIYVVPLLLGWLYKSLDTRQHRALSVILLCLATAICINNTVQMTGFIRQAIKYFPAMSLQ